MQILVTDFQAQGEQTFMLARPVQQGEAIAPDAPTYRFGGGSRLHYRASGQRACVGFRTLRDEGGFTGVACPQSRWLNKGTQCYQCSRADESWQIHNTPREKASPTLTGYLDRPHFLYLATFADGRLKVGTSRSMRRLSRWVEQGAVMTVRLGQYPDGWEVREAENLVSQRSNATQAVRTNTKAKAFADSLTQAALAQGLADSVEDTLNVLDAYGLRGQQVQPDLGAEGAQLPAPLAQLTGVDPWVNPVAVKYLGATHPAYDQDLTEGSHDFVVADLVGTTGFLNAENSGPDTLDLNGVDCADLCVANLAVLKAHVLEVDDSSLDGTGQQ